MLLAYIKAFHVIAIIAWMAGLLYLPRLFVYHAQSRIGSEQSETFKVMERRLLRYITTPAMLASWVLGLILAFSGAIDWSRDGWFHVKLPSCWRSRPIPALLAHVDARTSPWIATGARRVSTASPTKSRRCS